MDLTLQMDKKSAQLKNETKSEYFSAPADTQDDIKRTKIKAVEVRLIVQFKVHLIIHLELYLKVHFKIYTKMHQKAAHEKALKGAL